MVKVKLNYNNQKPNKDFKYLKRMQMLENKLELSQVSLIRGHSNIT